MGTDPVRRANLAAIECDRRPQLPEGFHRTSSRVGAALGATRTGLSVYELPPGQAISPYHFEDPNEEWLLVVSGTPMLRIRAEKCKSTGGTPSCSHPAPKAHTSCATTASQPPVSRCSRQVERLLEPSSTRTAT